MNPITAIRQRYFNTPRQIGDNKLATLNDVNKVVEQIPNTYVVNVSGDDNSYVDGKQPSIDVKMQTVLYLATFGEEVTSLLTKTTQIPIATVNSGQLDSSYRINVTIGAEDKIWDGGDLEIYLGSSKIGTITAAVLQLCRANRSIKFNLPLSTVMVLATGTYDPINGAVVENTKVMHARLSSNTADFKGFIGIEIFESRPVSPCGTYCASVCDYSKGSGQLYCSLIKGGCAFCPTLGLTGSQVVSI